MASKKPAKRSLQKAQRVLTFDLPDGVSYLDSAQALSAVNRKLFSQDKVYGIESVEYIFLEDGATVDTVSLYAYTAGDTWSVHNAHTKGKALCEEMRNLVLDDMPSIEGKWADFKVFLDSDHRAQFFLTGNMAPFNTPPGS